MIGFPKRALLLSLLVALPFTGCESSSPMELLEPSTVSSSKQAHGLRKVRGRIVTGVATLATSAVIGPSGGRLELGGHQLIVPAGAVSHPARFSLELLENGYVEVELNASSKGHGNNVGQRGFAVPVILELSYAAADGPVSPEELKIVWVRSDGSLEPLPSMHDAASQTVRAGLKHFSPYALASN